MPVRDACEPAVIRALAKEGWVVVAYDFGIVYDPNTDRYVYADLQLQQLDQAIIVAEVKCFTQNYLDELYRAVGQYAFYRNAMVYNEINLPIYLTVPQDVYEAFFSNPIVDATVKDVDVKVIVVNLEREEIVRWIT
jgi:hypothetical protein